MSELACLISLCLGLSLLPPAAALGCLSSSSTSVCFHPIRVILPPYFFALVENRFKISLLSSSATWRDSSKILRSLCPLRSLRAFATILACSRRGFAAVNTLIKVDRT